MNFRIEKAAEENITQIIALIREFAEYEKLSDYCEVTDNKLRSALFGTGAVAEALVAFKGVTAVAYAIFYPNFASFRGQCGFYLEDVFIKPEHRGAGLGESILKHIARIGKDRGFERIDFQVLEWNAPAIRFYERLGAERDDSERHYKFTDDAFKKLAS